MNKEFEFLEIINENLEDNSFLGDDCAFLKEENLCVSTDTLVEDVHFSRKFMNTKEIARKAFLVNISDAIASGGKIKYATIALSGSFNKDFIEEFYKETNLISKEFDFKIIGGDLTKSEKIFINITVFASTKNRNISSRKNAKEGYLVGTKGFFGSSAKGLLELQKGIKESEFINIHKAPVLYPKIADYMAKTSSPYAMMDSSDSLADCLYQISKKSKVKISVEYDKIPRKIEGKTQGKAQEKDLVLFGGEDYNLVICARKEDILENKDIVVIGKVEKGEGVFIDDIELSKEEIEKKEYKHFE